jgi:formylglycine-generating enzyme required for sulfatase activity
LGAHVLVTPAPGAGEADGPGADGASEARVDLAHEALLTRWPRLATWIREHEAALRERGEVEQAAARWQAAGEGPPPWSHERMLEAARVLQALGPDLGLDDGARRFLGPVDPPAMLAQLADPATTHAERAVIGLRLALLGDPQRGDGREGTGLRPDGLPDIAWHAVPGGEVSLEVTFEGGPFTRLCKALATRRLFTVEPFWIARYPITWAQYRVFLEAPDGYDNAAWWPVQGPYTNPPKPGATYPNYPATDVNWYEALAFCRWLSARLGYAVRLPTEWEWQQAATGGDPANVYPWGPEWVDERANTYESDLKGLTAVGCYPHGASPQGVEDLAGTVWEWCQNQYDRPEVIEVSGEGRRVVRGGAWYDGQVGARAGFRGRSHPGGRDDDLGFRLACSSPILER